MQRAANRAVEEHLADYQKLFNNQWSWKDHKDELRQAITMAIRSSDAYRDAAPAGRDSVARVLRKSQAFIDSVKRESAHLEVGFVAINHRNGSVLAMVGGS